MRVAITRVISTANAVKISIGTSRNAKMITMPPDWEDEDIDPCVDFKYVDLKLNIVFNT